MTGKTGQLADHMPSPPPTKAIESLMTAAYNASRQTPPPNQMIHLTNIQMLLAYRPYQDAEARARGLWSIKNLREQITDAAWRLYANGAIADAGIVL